MNKNTVFVLGTGFSRSAGIPLVDELRDEAFARCEWPKITSSCDYSSFEQLLMELRVSPDAHDLNVCRKLLHSSLRVLWEKHQEMSDLPAPYGRFAEVAGKSLGIVSLNWDLVCELALYTHDKAWTYSEGPGVQVIKPHGSINWTNHALVPKQKWKNGNGFVQIESRDSASYRPSDPFEDPLAGCDSEEFEYVTFPGPLQQNASVLESLWGKVRRLFANASTVTFIGYSLPRYDAEARYEYRTALSGKKISVINPCEKTLEAYRDFFGNSIDGQLNRFEDYSFL